MVNVYLLERCNRLMHVVFGVRRKMEASDHGMDFCDPRCRLRLLDGVDHAAMAARGENYEAPSFEG